MKPRRRNRGLTLFVTVGSTRFDKLINSMISKEYIEQLAKLGFIRIIVQAGKSDIKNQLALNEYEKDFNLDFELYDFKQSIENDIGKADIIVGHAGAGTCLEVLRMHKRLLIVTNDSLMDQHQNELADELSKNSYVIQTKLDNLLDNLIIICDENFKLSKFPPIDSCKFEKIFDQALNKVNRQL